MNSRILAKAEMRTDPVKNLHFFLGGRDLEMVTIAGLLDELAPGSYSDLGLAWGARVSAYRNEIQQALLAGQRPVLIELEDDLDLEPTEVISIDHHGARGDTDHQTSLHQVFALLGLPKERWSRWFDLVAANDRGHVHALLEVGATPDEISAVRVADRKAQGITIQEEFLGERAAKAAQSYARGRLLVVDLPHDRTATVTDRLHSALGGPGYENLLIRCPDEVNFYGSGKLVRLLDNRVPGGWRGGDIHGLAFWGNRSVPTDLVPLLQDAIGEN
jgi:hypothetical protein